jgi:hypothetical protein
MSDNKKPKQPTDIYTQSCGWRIKHGPHLGLDISGEVILSCPGAFEYPEAIDPTDVGDRYAS